MSASAKVPFKPGARVDLALLQYVTEAVMVCDAEANVLGMSASARKLHGLEPTQSTQLAEEVYRRHFDLCDPGTQEILPLSLWTSSRDREAQSPGAQQVLLRQKADGSSHLVTLTAEHLDSAYASGITLIRLREAHRTGSIEDSERRLRTVIEALPIGVWFTDAGGRIILGNTAGQRIWAGARYVGPDGYTQYQARWASTGEPITTEEWALSRALRGEESHDELIEIDTFDGERKIIRNSALPFRDEEGRILGALAVNEDVTEQWRAQEEHERLAALVESTTDAVIAKTVDGTVTEWNRGAEDLYGYTRAQAIGSPISIIIPQERSGEAKWLMELVQRGEVLRGYETERLRSDGGRVWISLSLSPIRNAAGRVIGATTIERDISENKKTADRLKEQSLALEAADRRRGELMAVVAHEIRNPLAALLTSVGIVRLQNPEGRLAESVASMERQIGMITRLLDDLMDVSRLSRGLLPVAKKRIDIATVIEQVLEIARPLMEEREHRLIVDNSGCRSEILGDQQRLVQAMANLLRNAAKYTEPGGIVSLKVSAAQENVVVRVRDSGAGIPRHMQPHIFDLFSHPERLPEHPSRGLGLGLTLVRQIVNAHGGVVCVHSEGLGTGSEFTISLPRLTGQGSVLGNQ